MPPTVRVAAPRLRTDTRPLPHDVAQLRSASSVRISPGGDRVAYVARIPTFDPDAPLQDDDPKAGWRVEYQIFIAPRAGGPPRQMTFGEGAATTPRWSPDGQTLGFLRAHKGKRSLHLLSLQGGEARVLELGDLTATDYAWAPDGARIAFLAEIPPSEDERTARRRRGGAIRFDEEWPAVGLYIAPIAGGEPVRVPPAPSDFGSAVDFAWSPDGRHIAVATAASGDPYEVWTAHRLHLLDPAGRAPARLIEAESSAIRHIAWSPDGRYLAYEWAANSLSMLNELRVRDVAGAGVWDATAELDPTLMGFAWSGDSRSLVAHVYERTASKLYRVTRDGRAARDLGPLARVLGRSLDASRDGRYLATTSSTPAEPWAPTAIDLADMDLRVVADLNPQTADWDLAETEIVRWTNPEGVEIEGVLHLPPNPPANAPPPLLVLPHGGPDSVSVDGFHSRAQYFAARGLAVLRPNYRGGFGYGQGFYEANRGRLGEIEFMDIESGVDALIAAGKADPDRLFYGGWSWGGYLTTWTITRTQRYRAAVVGAGVVDVVAQYVTSDINHGIVADWEYLGRPWQKPENFARANPSRSLQNIDTPTLILHGREDERVHFMNGVTLYRALHDLGKEVRFWAYPREPHGFREPAHVAHQLEVWALWYEAHMP